MAVEFSLDFNTDIGSNINYRLDILRDGFTGTSTSLVGTDTPISIEWPREDDPYAPILGSEATISLWLNEEGQYPRFNNAPEFTYEVRLSRIISSERDAILAGLTSSGPLTRVEPFAAVGNAPNGWFMNTGGANSGAIGSTWPLDNFLSVNGSSILGDTVLNDRILLIDNTNPNNWVEYRISAQTDDNAPATGGFRDTRRIARVAVSSVGTPTVQNFTIYTGSTVSNYATAGTLPSLTTAWNGWMVPIDGVEQVNTIPFNISFKATDYLGQLKNKPIFRRDDNRALARPLQDKQTPLIEFIQSALLETALPLDLYVESGLQNASGDVLINSTVNEWSFYNEDQTEAQDALEVVEGILTSLNCVLKQANGRWYIHNCSGVTDSTTWNVFIFDASTTPDSFIQSIAVTENLAYRVGGNTPDLTPLRNDFQVNTRQPYGSVQLDFDTLYTRNQIVNGIFADNGDGSTVEGFVTSTASIPLQFTTDDTDFLKGGEADVSGRAIRSSNNFEVANNFNELWFKNTSTGPFIDNKFPFEVSFDWKYRNRTNIASPRVRGWYQVILEFATPFNAFTFFDQANTVVNNGGLPSAGVQASNATRYYWNEAQSKWVPSSATEVIGEQYRIYYESDSNDTWGNETKQLPALSGQFASGFTSVGNNGRVIVQYAHPEFYNGDTARDASTSDVFTFIDNVNARHILSEQNANPINERFQANYSRTLNYTPALISNASPILYNQLSTPNSYWRTVDGGTNASIGQSVEEIVSWQKLGDWRGGNQTAGAAFKYYEATFVNNSTDPFTPVDKVNINFTWTDDNGTPRTYIETASTVFTGGIWDVKSNTINLGMFVPNQASGLVSEFSLTNVDLVAAAPPDRKPRITYNIGVRAIGTDDNNLVQIPSTLLPEGGLSNNANEAVFTIEGAPGDTFTRDFTLVPRAGFQVSASNLGLTNLSTINFTGEGERIYSENVGNSVKYTIQGIIPQQDDYDLIEIFGEVDPITENTISFNVAVSSSDANGIITLTSIPVSGEAGSVRTIQIPVNPRAGRQLLLTGFSSSLSTGLTDAGIVQNGAGLLWSISAAIPNTAPVNPMAIVLTVSDTAAAANVADQTFTLNFQEQAGGISNLSIATTPFPIHGPAGATFTHFRRANPAPGYRAAHGNDDSSSSNTTNAIVGDAIADGDGYLIPITGTIPTNGGTATITLGYTGTVPLIGADVVSTAVVFNTTNLNDALTDESDDEVYVNGRNTSGANTLLIIPDQGKRFTAASQVTISYVGDVTGVSKVLQPDGTVAVRYIIIFGSTSSLTGNTITISGTAVNEPYQAVLNITETLPQGRLVTSTLTTRFSSSDTGLIFNGVTITPNEGGMQYPSGTTFTITGGTAAGYSYSNGNVSFTMAVPLPTFTAANPIGDVSIDVSISTASTPVTQPATLAGTTVTVTDAISTTTGGLVTFDVDADGDWAIYNSGNGLARTPSSTQGPIAVLTTPISGGVGITTVTIKYSGTVAIGGSSISSSGVLVRNSTNTVTLGTIPSQVVVLASQPTIEANLGGTAGTTTGVIYLT